MAAGAGLSILGKLVRFKAMGWDARGAGSRGPLIEGMVVMGVVVAELLAAVAVEEEPARLLFLDDGKAGSAY